jgi:hypothetical protein
MSRQAGQRRFKRVRFVGCDAGLKKQWWVIAEEGIPLISE